MVGLMLELVEPASLDRLRLHGLFLIARIRNGLLVRLFSILIFVLFLFLFLIFVYLIGRA